MSYWTILKLIKHGYLPAAKIGGKYCVHIGDVQDFELCLMTETRQFKDDKGRTFLSICPTK